MPQNYLIAHTNYIPWNIFNFYLQDNEQVSNTLETLINHLKLQRQHDSDMVSQSKQVRETITVREMKILIYWS